MVARLREEIEKREQFDYLELLYDSYFRSSFRVAFLFELKEEK